MKIQPTLLFILLINFQFLFSQDVGLSVFTIPDSLTQNANAVVRFDNTNIELISQRKMIIKVKKAVTVLNKLGNDESKITVHYDQNKKIKELKAIVYNAFGKQIKKISKKDFKDYSAADGISLFNDGRLKYYEYIPTSYPYTIYYEYEVESSNTAFIRRWQPLDSYNQSVQQSIFEISYPLDLTLQKKEQNFKNYHIKKVEKNTHLSYQITGLLALKYEELSPSIFRFVPTAKLTFNKFRVEGLDGEANDWKNLGKWEYNNFYKEVGELPNSTKEQILQLVSKAKTPVEKAKIIYEYVQNKTRYISVQVGIGSLKPMLASEVDRLGYGDCKALTNYTKSLLDAVGIESYFTELYGNKKKLNMDYSFPSIQGNHVILNLPTDSGDVWLECTSQIVPFGYIANFTDDRDVIVITPEGGKLKHTSVYKDINNLQKTIATYKINAQGGINSDIKISSTGAQYDRHFGLEKLPERDIERYYKSRYWSYINNMAIDNYHFVNDKDSIVFNEFVTLKAADYASFSGDRMLFALNAFNRLTYIPKRYRNRKLPLEISRGFIDKDEFEIIIPDTYDIEAIPNDITIENKFGFYHLSVEKINPTKLKYTRTLLIKKGEYPKEDYKNYRSFRKKIAKLDKTKIVLIKKQS